MFGELIDGTADMAMSGNLITREKDRDTFPTFSFDIDGIQIYAPGKQRLPPYLAFVSPFDLWTWSLLGAIFFLFPVLLKIVFEKNYSFDITTLYFLSSAIFFKEPQNFFYMPFLEKFKVEKKYGLYILFGTFLMFGNVITMAYTCNLQALVIMPSFTKPINSLKQVTDFYYYRTFN